MKLIYCLILLGPLVMLTGCLDLTGSIARTGTVKQELPPEIDPNVPQPIEDEEHPSRHRVYYNNSGENRGRRSQSRGIPRPEEITEQNALQKASELREEMNFDSRD